MTCLELKCLILFLVFFLSQGFSFILSAIAFCDGNRIDDNDPGLNKFSEDIFLLEFFVLSPVYIHKKTLIVTY